MPPTHGNQSPAPAKRTPPRCQSCGRVMSALFARRAGGASHERIPEVYWCGPCSMVAKGRTRTRYLPA